MQILGRQLSKCRLLIANMSLLPKTVSINKLHDFLPLFLLCRVVGLFWLGRGTSVLFSVMCPELVLLQYKMLKYTW